MGMKRGSGTATVVEAPAPATTETNDAALVRDVLAGDLRAFEQLMRRHNRTLYRTARAILCDDDEAEDALQDAYLQAYRSLATFRGDARLSTWLTRIVANEAFARMRKRARRAAILPLHVDNDETAAATGPEREAPAMDQPDNATRAGRSHRVSSRSRKIPSVQIMAECPGAIARHRVKSRAGCPVRPIGHPRRPASARTRAGSP